MHPKQFANEFSEVAIQLKQKKQQLNDSLRYEFK